MDRLKELLGKITGLSDDELNELRDLVLAQVDDESTEPPEPGATPGAAALEKLESLAAAAEAVTNERARRAGNVTRSRDAKVVLASFRTGDARPPTVPADRRPNTRHISATRAVTASGHSIGNSDELAQEFISALRTQRAPNSQDGRILVATLHAASRPTLRRDDAPEAVTAALEAAATTHIAALTAAGGLGAPEQTDYTLPGFEISDRPVRSALPGFTTTRGGVRFMRPPTLAGLNGAVGIWTVANDIAAVNNPAVRKPSLRVVPGGEVVVDVQAVTNILTVGNMTARAYPEFVSSVTGLALAAHSRIAEQQLLTQLGALSTPVSGGMNEGGNLGATRVLLPLLDRAATAMRDRLRMQPDALLQLILPSWAKGILRTDLALQEPGDASVGVTDADLTGYLSTRYLTPTWALDGEAGQQFNPQAPGAVNGWPTSVVSYLFPAGAMQFLDGGALDLGLVRDTTLNLANDFQMFSETFEAVLFRGGESFRITQAVTPSGIARAAA